MILGDSKENLNRLSATEDNERLRLQELMKQIERKLLNPDRPEGAKTFRQTAVEEIRNSDEATISEPPAVSSKLRLPS